MADPTILIRVLAVISVVIVVAFAVFLTLLLRAMDQSERYENLDYWSNEETDADRWGEDMNHLPKRPKHK